MGSGVVLCGAALVEMGKMDKMKDFKDQILGKIGDFGSSSQDSDFYMTWKKRTNHGDVVIFSPLRPFQMTIHGLVNGSYLLNHYLLG